jgi:hypothetical protein
MPSVASLVAGNPDAAGRMRVERYIADARPVVYTAYQAAAHDMWQVMPCSEDQAKWRCFLAENLDIAVESLAGEPEWQCFRGYVIQIELHDVRIAATNREGEAVIEGDDDQAPDVLWLPDPPDGRPGSRLRFTAVRPLLGRIRVVRGNEVLPIPRRSRAASS